MTEEIVPEVSPRWSASDVLGVINVFERMLLAMEARLVSKMDDHNKLESDRWATHDAKLIENEKKIVARFERLENDILAMEATLESHLKREERQDIEAEARIKPLKGVIAWFWRNWRDLVLLLIGIVALGTFLVESYGRVIGPHAP
jgi:hypothetical protein